MQRLLELQRKNAVLRALESSWVEASSPGQDKSILLDTLLVLADAFGDDLPRHVHALSDAVPLLRDGALQSIATSAACGRVPTPGRAQEAKSEPQRAPAAECHVTLEAMDLAQSALEDFVSSYYMFHGLDANSPSDIFRYLPALAFVESYIYSLDQANEDSLLPASSVEDPMRRSPPLGKDPLEPLRRILRERGWLTPRIEAELEHGSRFWSLERKLGAALAGRMEGVAVSFDHGDVQEAIRLKSFDYRVLNLLLYRMTHTEPDEAHMEFLATSELLVEVGDDLVDYDEDVRTNSFNIYRCFLALHGVEHGQQELMRFIAAAEEEYSTALSRLSSPLAERWRQRCEGVRRHGAGSERGPGGGKWELPPPLEESAAIVHNLRKLH